LTKFLKKIIEYFKSKTIDEALLLILAFEIPIYPKLIPLTIASWALAVVTLRIKEFTSSYYKTIAFLLPVILFSLYVISLLYSTNLSYGLKDLETKTSLILFPLLSAFLINRKVQSNYKIAFVFGCISIALYCLIYAGISYYQEISDVKNHVPRMQYFSYDFFFSSQLSKFLHPSYLSLYCCFAICILFENLIQKQNKTLTLLAYIFLSFFIVLLGSRAGLFCLFLIILFHTSRLIFKSQIKIGIGIILCILTIFILVFKKSETFRERFNAGVKAFTYSSESQSSELSRFSIWNSAQQVFKKNKWIGVGAGDAKDELIAQYQLDGKTQLYEKRLNAHSQFLQTAVALGSIGLVILLCLFFYGLFVSICNKDWIFISFLVLSILNFFVEAMLETQAGVVFFSFFYSLLFTKYISKNGKVEIKPFIFAK